MRSPIFLLTASIFVQVSAGNTSITFPRQTERENAFDAQGHIEHQKIETQSHREPENPFVEEVAHRVSNLGLNTLRDLLSRHSNVILSPLNIRSCLGILNLGADGETKEEIRRIIGLESGSHNGGLAEAKEGVAYASAAFLDHSLVPKKEFAEAALAEYQASIFNMNVSDGEGAQYSINRWVSEHTNGTIQQLLRAPLEPSTKMVVVSTLMFKASWLHPFPPAIPGKFEIDENTSVDIGLMHMQAVVPVVRNLHFDAIGLPYEGNRMTMYLILPKVHGVSALKKLLSHLNANSLRKLRTEGVNKEIFIVVPKLKLEGSYSLTNSLKKQGITTMFNPATANFTNLAEEASGLFVSHMYQSILLEIDEKGTAAFAATAAIITKSGKFLFRATRPFLFVLMDDKGLVMFMGAVVHP